MGDAPVIPAILLVVTVTTVPAAMITYFFGGKGVFVTWLGVAVCGGLWLVWVFGFKSRVGWTGMEGIILVVVPGFLVALGVGMFLGYAVVTILREWFGKR